MVKVFKFFETIMYPKGYLRCEMEVYYYKDGWLSAETSVNVSVADHFTPRIKKIWLAGYFNYLSYKEFGTIPSNI